MIFDKKDYRHLACIFVSSLILLTPAIYAGGEAPAPLPTAYLDGVDDSRVPLPSEINDQLVAINAENQNLIRKTIEGEEHILVVTWVAKNYYPGLFPQKQNNGPYIIWVTCVPQLKDFCSQKEISDDGLNLRLEQVLGLPPRESVPEDSRKKLLVEYWVKPGDLVRPCPDSEIDDSSCGLNMPADTAMWYREWFHRNQTSTYCESCNIPYPWTQLGYTYDWGPSEDHVGMSEFLLVANSTFYVNSVNETAAYCGR